jgi:kinesin family protein 5
VYTYNQVFGEASRQHEVFHYVGLPVIDGVFQGFNGTIFAYGQTGSGKTHTMMGPDYDPENPESDQRGIIPRALEVIFGRVLNAEMECSIHVSFFEIYNEKVNDLLDPKNKNIDMRNVNTEWEEVLTQKTVNGLPRAMQILGQGISNRKTGATDMNAVSSRSHSIFVISVKQTDITSKRAIVGKLYLVDLAGSEKQKKTNATGDRFKEGTNINKSLFVLSRVISALTEGQFVPYRDSVLTKVLKHSLGGNCKTALVINVSPAQFNESETKNTLDFGSNAKKIKNDPRVNTTDDNQELAELKSVVETQRVRIAELIRQVEMLGGGDMMNSSFTSNMSDFDLTSISLNDSMLGLREPVPSGMCSVCRKDLDQEEKELTHKCEDLSVKVRDLKAKFKKVELTHKMYQQRITKMETESKKFKDQLESHQTWMKKQVDLTDTIKKCELEIPRLNRQATKVKNQYNELKERVDKEEQDLLQLHERSEELELSKKEKMEHIENLKVEKSDIEKKNLEATERLSEVTKQRDTLLSEENELTTIVSRAESAIKEKQELQIKHKSMIVKVSKENDRLSDQLASLELDLTRYNERYQVLSISVQNQKKSNEEIEHSFLDLSAKKIALVQQADEMQHDIQIVAGDLKDLEMHRNSLVSSTEAEKRIIETLKQELSDVQSSIESQKKYLSELKPQEEQIINDIGMLEAKLISLKDSKQRLARERSQLDEAIPYLSKLIAEQRNREETLIEELELLKREQKELLIMLSKTREDIIYAKKEATEYNKLLVTSENELTSKRADMEKLKQEIENCTEQKKFYECQLGILKIQVDSLQQKISDLKFLKIQLEEHSISLNNDISTLTTRCDTQESDRDELLARISELRAHLSQLCKTQSDCKTECDHMLQSLHESNEQLTISKDSLSQTKQELQATKLELDKKKAQLNNLNGQVTSNSEQLIHIQQKNESLRTSIEQLEEEHRELVEKLREERERISKEKHAHFEKLMEEESKRRELEKRYREDILDKSLQLRKVQDDKISSEINEYNYRLEQAVKEMQHDMSLKMQLLSVQSQEFERKILAITRRKKEINAEFQLQSQRVLIEPTIHTPDEDGGTASIFHVPKVRQSTGTVDSLM